MAERCLRCVGLDHHRTPLDLRERLSVPEVAVPDILARLQDLHGVDEAVVLSTCNRTELYVAGSVSADALCERLAEEMGVAAGPIRDHRFEHQDDEAVRHLFRVVASLESLVIGEYQIVHQVKAAYEAARRGGHTGGNLDPLFQRALGVAKTVRNATRIGAHKVSVASVGVDLARHIHGDLERARLLVIGAGEIAELAAVHLAAAGVRTITVINRTHERAMDLARDDRFAAVSIEAIRWSELVPALGAHDIVVASTAATRPVVTVEEVKRARRSRLGPLMFIDLAVPRDIDVAVGDLPDVYRYDLDHLDQIVAANRQVRDDEVGEAAALVEREVAAFQNDRRINQASLPADVATWFEHLANAEGERLARRLLAGGDADALAREGVHRALAKVQHRIMALLRESDGDPAMEAWVRKLLDL